ncbi:MAG: glycosyltransferase [Rhodanobacteraceae bacterium]|nr:glycosyltransferase [Rhodanobacteraceae bacterium]
MQNLVSVLLPVHNGGVWLADAVASVLAQSWRALELLVIDDHSSDGAVDGLPRDDLRLRVLPSPSRGIVAALNTGLAAARGGWIARMDADDVCAPERITVQIAYAAACPQIDIVASRVELIDTAADSGLWRYIGWSNALTEPQDIARELFIESPLVHPTVLLRTDLLRQLGGWRDGDFPEDYELWLRAAQAGCRFGKPEPTLLQWRDHGRRLTRSDARYAAERFLRLKAAHLARWRVGGRAVWIGGAGPGGRALHDALRREGVEVIGFIDVHPRRIGGAKRGLPVWPYARLAEPLDAIGLIAVGNPGAHARVRADMAPWGLREGVDWLFVL